MSIKYISQKVAQQVRISSFLSILDAANAQIDEELMSASGAFSLDQVSQQSRWG